MRFKEFITENQQYYFIGTCVNSFDKDGECSFRNYRDTTDFAQGEEDADEISKEEFDKHCKTSTIKLGKKLKYLYDKENDVYMIYDENKDVHYFWVKQ